MRRRIAAVGEVVRRMRGEVLVEVKEYEVRTSLLAIIEYMHLHIHMISNVRKERGET